MKRIIIVISVLFLLVPFNALAQEPCEADLNGDGEVNKLDWEYFKEAYKAGRGMTDCDSGVVLYPTPIPKTGQTTSYATGDDGDLQKGVTWPNPRFTDNGDGTVTDNLTGLIWLKNANCFGQRTWNDALSDSNGLNSGECGLTDGSSAGDWRLPNKRELFSITHDGYYGPVVPNTAGTGQWTAGDPFTDVQSDYYWSSTTGAFDTAYAWLVSMKNGVVSDYWGYKTIGYYVWPVRGGH